ncbi:MAG: sigma-70 family RNA polymerase sigma factor [Bacteroidales bacterium]|nr:sigma-70 family RNA polymerase sigma factor [Bacteroidales bacterium]MDP3002051.1 sigma-70 family RNA polymerase sigma factor [Bacteroidales bacterium]
MNTFEEIYTENYKTMFRVATRMVGDSDDVSDIVQEIFIDFFNKLNNGNIIHHPKSWLYRATINKCVDNLRNRKRFQNLESLGEYKSESGLLENQEMKDAINLAISKLKPQEKNLATFYSEGLSYKEIAEVTGIKFSSIGKMLSRTLKKMEKELKNQRYELYS